MLKSKNRCYSLNLNRVNNQIESFNVPARERLIISELHKRVGLYYLIIIKNNRNFRILNLKNILIIFKKKLNSPSKKQFLK
jgi:hypothetical protein